jgi:hypothetical protein
MIAKTSNGELARYNNYLVRKCRFYITGLSVSYHPDLLLRAFHLVSISERLATRIILLSGPNSMLSVLLFAPSGDDSM